MFKLETVVPVAGECGSVNCCEPFVHEEKHYLAFGTDNGIYVTDLGEEDRRTKKVADKTNVTMCDTIGPYLVVLADKRIMSYSIDALVAVTQSAEASEPKAEELRDKTIEFFRVGSMGDKKVLLMMHKKKKDNVFRTIELAPEGSAEAFKTTRDFFLAGPYPCFDMSFMKSSFALYKSPGFEIMDPTSFKSVTIPQNDDKGLSKDMHKRLKPKDSGLEKPLGIFKANDEEFIICYEANTRLAMISSSRHHSNAWLGLGLFVTKHGDASRGGDDPAEGAKGKVEWTHRVRQIALYASHLFLFGAAAGGVEVRSVASGEVVQTLGLEDEVGGASPAPTKCLWGEGALGAVELYALVENGGQRRIVKVVEVKE
ncbi:hypothetical protein SCHPADRAFT_998589 [Schizopora paradoxa]|uniref:CNH domain-containing protein n=1 Tax=Schizopora paradoxa TaxID=27342 RepID=A0A0H2RJI8_9AGAM|nr:hypothetical protein SCHPADRAFT_998589 [Schizopora paradoxa]